VAVESLFGARIKLQQRVHAALGEVAGDLVEAVERVQLAERRGQGRTLAIGQGVHQAAAARWPITAMS
jgi:hypothetical protein